MKSTRLGHVLIGSVVMERLGVRCVVFPEHCEARLPRSAAQVIKVREGDVQAADESSLTVTTQS